MTANFTKLCEAVDAEDVDGWLFYGFQHRDPLAEDLLGLPKDAVNTRRWFYLLFPDPARCIKITNAVEKDYLSALPGKEYVYSSLSELKELLTKFDGLYLAAQFSPEIAIFSYLDYGTVLLLKTAGISICPSGSLIQKVKGLLDTEGIASHEGSAAHLYEIVSICRKRLASSLSSGTPCREGDIQELILDEFAKRGLICNHPPIVAAGRNSRDPHYMPKNGGAAILPNMPVQLDLWAKEDKPEAVYADISWVLYSGKTVPAALSSVFSAVKNARDKVIDFLNTELPRRRVSGAEADTVARSVLIEAGYQRGIQHRTGHGIDTEAHGYGVNLDSVEFPDTRFFMEGSCFSIEPGLYLEEFGMRSEINVYIKNGVPVISGGPVQQEVMTLG